MMNEALVTHYKLAICAALLSLENLRDRRMHPTASHSKRPITSQKKPYHDRVHCNDKPKQNEIHTAQSLYLIRGVSKLM